jgi:hypothetical protein
MGKKKIKRTGKSIKQKNIIERNIKNLNNKKNILNKS